MQRKNTITTKDKLKKRRKESLWDDDQGKRVSLFADNADNGFT